MFIVGVSGGIGSGKTTVTDMFADKGITVVDADTISRSCVAVGSPALSQLVTHFSNRILLADGGLNRAKLRDIIFKSPMEKNVVESIIHPLVRNEIHAQLQSSSSAYTLLSSPLLLETQQAALSNRILIVDVPVDLQISRTLIRDKIDKDQVNRIIATQSNRQFKLEKADDVIDNSQTLDHTRQQVTQLHERYLTYLKNT